MSETNYVDVVQPDWKMEIGVSKDKVVSIDWREMPSSEIEEPFKLRLYKILMDAIRIIRLKEIMRLNHVINGWISVKDRLPERNEDQSFLLLTKNGKYLINTRTKIDDWFVNKYNITHWMYLPEPPKEEG